MEKTETATAFAHADKIIGISAEEKRGEWDWQKGQGLVEIIDNVLRYLEESRNLSAIGRIVELQSMRRKLRP